MADTTTAYEHEAAVTRERIATTIDDLQARLSPKALFDNALESLSAAGTKAVAEIKTSAASHPLALGAAGLVAGVGLLARSRLNKATVEYGDSYAAYADYDDGYAANLAADDPPSHARQQFSALQHQAATAVDDNPFAVVAVGLATGIVLGAVVPVSAAESEFFVTLRLRLAAAGTAAIDAAKGELDMSKLSLAGGTVGISERLTASLLTVAHAAGSALLRPVSGR